MKASMSQENLLKNKEFLELVRICCKRRLRYKEAIIILREAGFPTSEKTYQRAKVEIERSIPNRFEQIAHEFGGYALDTIDTSNAVDAELWAIVRSTKDEWVKVKTLDLIIRNCDKKSDNVETNPVLARIAKKLDQQKQAEQKEKQTLQTALAQSDTHDMEEDKSS